MTQRMTGCRPFAARHPKVTFSFTLAESEEIVARVPQNRARLGICLLHIIPAGLKASVLCRGYFGLFCGPCHRLFGADVGIGALPLHVARRDIGLGRLGQRPPYDDLPLVNI